MAGGVAAVRQYQQPRGVNLAGEHQRQYGLPAFADYATVIHYGRYSSANQASGTSEERQLDRAYQWAADAVPVVAQAVADAKRQVVDLQLQLHQVRAAIHAMESDARRQLGSSAARGQDLD